jgi:polar amino acid transport system substrate-binding protein
MIRFATRVLSMSALLVATWACAEPPASSTSAAPTSTEPLRWGGDAEGGAPFVEADAADPTKLHGFDVEIAAMIAQGLGREPQFVQVAWASIEQSVARGDFTVGMSGLEDRPALHERFAVSLPYYEFREVLAVRAADSARVHTLADLRGRRVATLGSTMAWEMLLAAKSAHGVLPVSYDDDVHPYSDLVSGRVDAVLLDQPEEVRRRVAGEGGLGEVGAAVGDVVRRGSFEIGEIAAPSARNANFLGQMLGMIDQGNAQAALCGHACAEQAGGSGANDHRIKTHGHAGIPRSTRSGKREKGAAKTIRGRGRE